MRMKQQPQNLKFNHRAYGTISAPCTFKVPDIALVQGCRPQAEPGHGEDRLAESRCGSQPSDAARTPPRFGFNDRAPEETHSQTPATDNYTE
ncbi:unnamed protein product [Gadus morhua 'NCC']